MRERWEHLSSVDRCIGVGAAVVFIAGFLPWWGYSGPVHVYGGSISGFSSGFTAWAGILLLAAAGALHVARVSSVRLPALPLSPAVAVAGVAALGLLLVVIRWLTLPSVHAGLAGSVGAKFGIWIAIVAGIVELAAAVVALRASGEALPWEHPAQPDQP
jgi:hypothetical protein